MLDCPANQKFHSPISGGEMARITNFGVVLDGSTPLSVIELPLLVLKSILLMIKSSQITIVDE
jgi:hypothetical protein